jgi:hypothetical protein
MSSSMLRAARRRRRLVVEKYLAAGVGVAALVSSAEASIVSINLASFGITGANAGLSSGASHLTNNFPIAGSGDLEVYNQYMPGSNTYWGLDGDSSGNGSLRFAVTGSSKASPRNFSSGSMIDSTATWNSSASRTSFRYNAYISPDFGPNSYMGMRFSTDGGTTYHYGWIEVTWNSTTSTFELLSAAYESTPNTGIVAGATGGAVPEPGSGAMVALLMGGTALNQWRKNRRESAEGASGENAELAS